jgi:hypothetical protein
MQSWLRAIGLVWVALLVACQQPAAPAGPTRAPLRLPPDSARFTVYQRNTVAIPGSGGELLLTIDDITRGQTMSSLEWRDGERVLGPRALRVHDSVDFSVGTQHWRLTVTQMHNQLIGDDWAEFSLIARPESGAAADPQQEIEALLAAVGALDGAEFIRNGSSSTPTEAAQHLREKWQAATVPINSAEDFITAIGARSTASGEPYQIRLSDGSLVSSESWLRQELQGLRQAQ